MVKTSPSDTADDTIAARISRILAERIVRGAQPPGERLRQDHVAAEFCASHVPLREAFRRLEAQGLAVNIPRRGVRVADFCLDDVREMAECAPRSKCWRCATPDRCHSRRGGSRHA